ncbi:hypothetical protein FVO59_07635 [Microbacterium esteraromaticum]|uniref:Secreted protein n=1 Tax=Microbacterium esteraromaticum TaxID=57043 RepID=A0A7D7WF26_9MICO|nr:hypothetical protein [Microbacterium esteraromaticum]QMU97112.1 hypothetical protein FVO59_07635 [Microbacterium esteraromaticum]
MRRGAVIAIAVLTAVAVSGCTPPPPSGLSVEPGEDFPGTCMPPELSWPTDFLESLVSENDAVDGELVGLRLVYIDDEWAWRLRSRSPQQDWAGDPIDDPSSGRESLVTTRELRTLRTYQVTLTEAEQLPTASGALAAATESGETWPSPLIIDMTRAIESGRAVWRVTTCDTATNEHTVITVD